MTTPERLLTLALLAQLIFTFAVMIRAGRARLAAGREGRVKGDIALSNRGWPADVLKLSNNMNNQFETPTLFYALGLLALVLKLVTLPFALLAWGYVAGRVVHMAIHTGSNRIIQRFSVFLVSVGFLMAMTVLLVIDVLRAA